MAHSIAKVSTRTRRAGRISTAAVIAVSALLLGSCGLQSGGAVPLSVNAGSIEPVSELEGVKLTVGSKDFTEQIILGYILEFSLSAAGADVRDLTNITGSNSARDAMLAGQVDLYVEYTGTGWINYLKNEEPVKGKDEQFEAVRAQDLEKNNVAWVDPAPLNNTYSLATSERVAEQTGVQTLSDYARLITENPGQYATCLETEFNSRQDGFPGMAETYNFNASDTEKKLLQTGIIYQATAGGSQCQFGEIFTTDGRIKGLNLVVLEDDKTFFPHYNAAITMLDSTNDAHPEIAAVLEPVMTTLTTDETATMNARVDVDGVEPADVARDWLADKGFVTIP